MSLTPNEYQAEVAKTAIYPASVRREYVILGLNDEAGEVAGAYKKFLRRDYDYEEAKRRIKKELGDVLWYAARIATEFDLTLEDIMIGNIDKLANRKVRGTLTGDGDDR